MGHEPIEASKSPKTRSPNGLNKPKRAETVIEIIAQHEYDLALLKRKRSKLQEAVDMAADLDKQITEKRHALAESVSAYSQSLQPVLHTAA